MQDERNQSAFFAKDTGWMQEEKETRELISLSQGKEETKFKEIQHLIQNHTT